MPAPFVLFGPAPDGKAPRVCPVPVGPRQKRSPCRPVNRRPVIDPDTAFPLGPASRGPAHPLVHMEARNNPPCPPRPWVAPRGHGSQGRQKCRPNSFWPPARGAALVTSFRTAQDGCPPFGRSDPGPAIPRTWCPSSPRPVGFRPAQGPPTAQPTAGTVEGFSRPNPHWPRCQIPGTSPTA